MRYSHISGHRSLEKWAGNNNTGVSLEKESLSLPGRCTSTTEPAQRGQIQGQAKECLQWPDPWTNERRLHVGGDRWCLGLWPLVLLCCISPEVLHTTQLFQILKRKCQWFKAWCLLQSYFLIWDSGLLFFSLIFLLSPFSHSILAFGSQGFYRSQMDSVQSPCGFLQCTLEEDQCRKFSMMLIPQHLVFAHTFSRSWIRMVWHETRHVCNFCLPWRLKAKTDDGHFLVAFLFFCFYNVWLRPDESTATPKVNRQTQQNYSGLTWA